MVDDDTDSATFSVFAKEAEKLIDVSATDLMGCIEERENEGKVSNYTFFFQNGSFASLIFLKSPQH